MALPVLVRDSEPYSPRGNVASAGVSNQLGRPRLDPLAVFVREGVQNCWDAHLPYDPHIEVEIGLRNLTAGEVATLRANILADPAPASPIAARLTAAEAGEPLRMLWLADRGTAGLGGPTRADAVAGMPGGPTDFVDLLRNVGQPPDKAHGGGTFGYGKAALFRLSAVGVLLVHTHCKIGRRREARFMGIGLGPQYTEPDDTGAPARFTGRHWWGTQAADGIVDPVTGEAADHVASALGLPAFDGDGRGTTIAILDPRLGDGRSPKDAAGLIIEALLWNFWPKMLDGPEGRPAIRFRVLLDGAPVEVPSPEDSPPLDGYVQALRHLDAHVTDGPGLGHVVSIKRYTTTIGSLSLVRFPRVQRRKEHVEAARLVGGIGDPACHVALMRSPRLIVQYAPHPPLQSDTWQFAGVFVVADEHDRPFAHAEPPTHDDWVTTQLADKRERSIVNVALRDVAKETMAFAHPTQDAAASARGEGLGPLSARLGQMLIGLGEEPDQTTPKVTSSRPRVRHPTNESDAPPAVAEASVSGAAEAPGQSATNLRPAGRPSIRLLDGELVVHGERGALSTRFRLKHGIRTHGTRLRAVCRASLEGGDREDEPPDGAEVPVVLAWIDPDGMLLPATADTVVATPDQEGEWRVIVSLIDDASIDVSVRGEAVLTSEENAG